MEDSEEMDKDTIQEESNDDDKNEEEETGECCDLKDDHYKGSAFLTRMSYALCKINLRTPRAGYCLTVNPL